MFFFWKLCQSLHSDFLAVRELSGILRPIIRRRSPTVGHGRTGYCVERPADMIKDDDIRPFQERPPELLTEQSSDNIASQLGIVKQGTVKQFRSV